MRYSLTCTEVKSVRLRVFLSILMALSNLDCKVD